MVAEESRLDQALVVRVREDHGKPRSTSTPKGDMAIRGTDAGISLVISVFQNRFPASEPDGVT